MRVKLGDTLIEVALAIGIFSLVAVAVVAVVSGSTSSAQSALELTITREEIDAQAEALRFIQSSYIAGGQANIGGDTQTKYAAIWSQITDRALDFNNIYDKDLAEAALNYNPRTCTELYESSNTNSIVRQKAFIINTRNIGTAEQSVYKNKVVIPADSTSTQFSTASTYPRILYSSQNNSDALYDGSDTTTDWNQTIRENGYTMSRAEGIFIVAVKDSGSSVVQANGMVTTKSAYYDFYIRSCWFTPGAERPSTIQTVIRLQDPAVIEY